MSARTAVIFFLAALVTSAPAFGDPPPWAGGGKSKHGKERDYDRDDDRGERDRHFGERHRMVVREYYGQQFRHGKCPPGLAKKHNGCMPPGQAKKWSVGEPLPRDVVYYKLPPVLVAKLPPPSAGERYVRVAGDILLIAVGTGMVLDAIRDLGAM
jgi:Ni/Co efflux regulator RcnB